MEGRNYGSGFSTWGNGGGSGNRGSGNFDVFAGNYKNSMSNYGGYGGGNSKRGLSGSSIHHQKITHADEVIAKINQRLDMLTQLEGGMKGARNDRFGQLESFDSLSTSSSSSRDLFRSGGGSYGCDDGRGDNMLSGQRGGSGFGGGMGQGGGSGFNSLPSSYGVAKMRQNMRESFDSGSGGGGWAGRSPRRGGGAGGRESGGGFGGYRSDHMAVGGGGRGGGPSPGRGRGGRGGRGGGPSPGRGRGKLPSLLSNRMYPEGGGFHQGPSQGPYNFPGRHFGGGPWAGRQRGRKRPLNKQPPKTQNDTQKKRKQMATPADEPESKMNKTESTDADANPIKKEDNSDATMATTTAAAADSETTDGESGGAKQDDGGETAAQDKQFPPHPSGKFSKAKKKRGFQERVMFACSVCKFRSFYKNEMLRHLASRFHKEHFKFLSAQLSKPTTDFLQEYLSNKFDKTDHMVKQLDSHSASICQMYRDQDLTKDIDMEHFLKKVEAAHCSACDIFIPMEHYLIQKHIKSHDHNYNRKGMMEQSKRASLSVARSILNHRVIGKKLESYLKGENPFTGNREDEGEFESMLVDATEDEQSAVTDIKEESEAVAEAEEAIQDECEADAVQEVKIQDDEVKEAGMEEEQGKQVDQGEQGKDGEQEAPDEEDGEEGFEVGEDEDDEEGYVVHDEIDEEEGAEVCAAVVDEDELKEPSE
ncbi:A-kinase anchor protein 8-like [Stigmatopora argus]